MPPAPKTSRAGPRVAYVVSGAASGIGRAVAMRLLADGHDVAMLDRDVEAVRKVAKERERSGGPRALALSCDVTYEPDLEGSVAQAVAELGPLGGAVTCAGIDRGGLVHELPIERWRQVIDVNLTGTFLVAKHVLSHLVGRGAPGVVICVSSPWAYLSAAGGASAYCASKGAVCSLVRSMALDYADHGIRVNAILPGATETPLMWANVTPESLPAMRAQVASSLPMRRLADPAEIAAGVAWMLGPDAGYMTGAELVLDGGLMAKGCINV